ncbi:MAG: universal stress protein, partial [Pseudomonadota bacterium]
IPADEIVQHAADHDVDLVVMGAVSRSVLRNALIGNTAEKVLDRLDADTLIIKPAAATTPGR